MLSINSRYGNDLLFKYPECIQFTKVTNCIYFVWFFWWCRRSYITAPTSGSNESHTHSCTKIWWVPTCILPFYILFILQQMFDGIKHDSTRNKQKKHKGIRWIKKETFVGDGIITNQGVRINLTNSLACFTRSCACPYNNVHYAT